MIISMDVGGTVFRTCHETILKYPNSKLAEFDWGKKEFFLDQDPEYFREVLNFLRNGEVVSSKDEKLFDGVKCLAKELELTELVDALEKDFNETEISLEFFSLANNEGVISSQCHKIARKYLLRQELLYYLAPIFQ